MSEQDWIERLRDLDPLLSGPPAKARRDALWSLLCEVVGASADFRNCIYGARDCPDDAPCPIHRTLDALRAEVEK